MEATTVIITANALKSLIFSIAEQKLPIGIRFRNLGQLWYPNFLQIVETQGAEGVLFHDARRNQLISLPDLSTIIQFELDSGFYLLEPNCHYEVSGTSASEICFGQ